jgi:hypothetical protein
MRISVSVRAHQAHKATPASEMATKIMAPLLGGSLLSSVLTPKSEPKTSRVNRIPIFPQPARHAPHPSPDGGRARAPETGR